MNAAQSPAPSSNAARLGPNDHRSVGGQLDLFSFHDEAPGMVFWHPRGFALFRRLEAAARRLLEAQGYAEIRTPQVMRVPVWEASGHWRHFRSGMMELGVDKVPAALKPVSCPGHLMVAGRRPPSHRELPLRLAEFGVVHRNEASGSLQGLLRLRQFTQDDGHILCADDEQARAEVARFCAALPAFYGAFGFEGLDVALSTRPREHAGSLEQWARAEGILAGALGDLGWDYEVQVGEGAFYGPKIEFALRDRNGRAWQCGTIQMDLVMPGRFGQVYVDASGERRPLLMLHRALYGSLERFMGLLLEHYGPALPAWLAPVQVRVLPVGEGQLAYAREVLERLVMRGIRAELDEDGSLSKRLARAHVDGVPFQLIAGAKELAAGELSCRSASGQRRAAAGEIIGGLIADCAWPEFEAQHRDPATTGARANLRP